MIYTKSILRLAYLLIKEMHETVLNTTDTKYAERLFGKYFLLTFLYKIMLTGEIPSRLDTK
jgi:hypothetical protein